MNEQPDHRLESIEPGWDVYGSDDQKIGAVEAVQDASISVEKGLLFVHDMYVPASAVQDVDPDERRVTLNVPRDAVGDQGWTEPAITRPGEGRETWGQGTIEADAAPDPLLSREPVLEADESADVQAGPTSERLWDR